MGAPGPPGPPGKKRNIYLNTSSKLKKLFLRNTGPPGLQGPPGIKGDRGNDGGKGDPVHLIVPSYNYNVSLTECYRRAKRAKEVTLDRLAFPYVTQL